MAKRKQLNLNNMLILLREAAMAAGYVVRRTRPTNDGKEPLFRVTLSPCKNTGSDMVFDVDSTCAVRKGEAPSKFTDHILEKLAVG